MVSPLFLASLFCSMAYAAPFRTSSDFWLCSSDSAHSWLRCTATGRTLWCKHRVSNRAWTSGRSWGANIRATKSA